MPSLTCLKPLCGAALVAAAALLAGCAGPVRSTSEAQSATPGVTVYGTVDAGIGKVRSDR